MKTQKSEEDILYGIGLAALILVILGALACVVFHYSPMTPLFGVPCGFRAITGFYCPGCGGTRAVYAILHGKFLSSLYCHPAVLPALIFYVVFMGSHTVEKIFHPRNFHGLKYRHLYTFLIVGLLLFNFVMKNVLLLCGIVF